MKLTGHDPELWNQRLEDFRLERLTTQSIRIQEMKRVEFESRLFGTVSLLSFYIAQHVASRIGPEWTELDLVLVGLLGLLSCKSFLDSQEAWRELLKIAEDGK